jgi:hypothetical protein
MKHLLVNYIIGLYPFSPGLNLYRVSLIDNNVNFGF